MRRDDQRKVLEAVEVHHHLQQLDVVISDSESSGTCGALRTSYPQASVGGSMATFFRGASLRNERVRARTCVCVYWKTGWSLILLFEGVVSNHG